MIRIIQQTDNIMTDKNSYNQKGQVQQYRKMQLPSNSISPVQLKPNLTKQSQNNSFATQKQHLSTDTSNPPSEVGKEDKIVVTLKGNIIKRSKVLGRPSQDFTDCRIKQFSTIDYTHNDDSLSHTKFSPSKGPKIYSGILRIKPQKRYQSPINKLTDLVNQEQ